MEAPQPQPSPIEIANKNGAHATVEYPHQFGPTLGITIANKDPHGPQYVYLRLSYGNQTVPQVDLPKWQEKVHLFEIRSGTPEPGKLTMTSAPSLIRLERKNTIEGTKLTPQIMPENPSPYQKSEGLPSELPTVADLLSIANLLEDQSAEIGQAINEATPPLPGQELIGHTLHQISQGLSQEGIPTESVQVERVFNAPSVREIAEFIREEASKLQS